MKATQTLQPTGGLMNWLRAATSLPGSRTAGLRLLFEAMLLHQRSRIGFLRLLAFFRVLTLAALVANYWISSKIHQPVAIAALGGYFLVVGYNTLVIAREKKHADRDEFHRLMALFDIFAITLLILVNRDVRTDLYLFYLLPLTITAHFLSRREAIFFTALTVLVYMGSLIAIQVSLENGVGIVMFWVGPARATFLLASVWLYRIQRNLPSSDETRILSPSQARSILDDLLSELRNLVEYDTASIQILYRDNLEIVTCAGFPDETKDAVCLINFPTNDDRFPNKQVIQKRSWVIADAGEYASFRDPLYQASEVRTWMGVPIKHPSTGELFGLISIDSKKPGAYTRREALIASWFASKAAAFIIEAALGPSALTLSSKKEALSLTIKKWVKGLPRQVDWTDDIEAARHLAQTYQKVFQVEDCSVYFLRTKNIPHKGAVKVLHLVASTAIPPSEFTKNESLVSGCAGDGLTGYAVFKNRTINYGFQEIEKSPHHGSYTRHLEHLPSKRCKQVMVVPVWNSRGEPIGALKIENKIGWPSYSRFPYAEQNLFEATAQVLGYIIEEVRERNYTWRQRTRVHNLRSIYSGSVIKPLERLAEDALLVSQHGSGIKERVAGIEEAVKYTASQLDKILMDPDKMSTLENLGLVPALQAYISFLSFIPPYDKTCKRICFANTDVRDDLPFKVRVAFYNIAQEAIMNLVRHACIDQYEHGQATVTFDYSEGSYILCVEDNGIGFLEKEEQVRRSCYGLDDMREQVKNISRMGEYADLEIVSKNGEGTRVRVTWTPSRDWRMEYASN